MPKKDLAEEVLLLFSIPCKYVVVPFFLLSLPFFCIWSNSVSGVETSSSTWWTNWNHKIQSAGIWETAKCNPLFFFFSSFFFLFVCKITSHSKRGLAFKIVVTLSIGHVSIFSVLQEKVLCRVCFEREISVVLLPCRHRVLCRYSYTLLHSIKCNCGFCWEHICLVLLLMCFFGGHVCCRNCSEKCKKCPFCRVTIEERLPVYDV